MILKLRNDKIIIDRNNVPEKVDDIIITYDFELGTNHYDVKLTVDDAHVHYGNNLRFKYDSPRSSIDMKVELIDTHGTIMRTYTGTYQYYKMCAIGEQKLIDVYKELERLYIENKELKERGEVI